MDIPKFLKKNLDKVVTEQQLNTRKLCKTCYETLFELNEYDKRIQNSLKHMNALKSKIKSTISMPDSSPPSPEVENESQEENPELQDNFEDDGAESSQEDFSQEDSMMPEPNVSEDDSMTYELMNEQDDNKSIIPMFALEPQESQKQEPPTLKNVPGMSTYQNFMVNDPSNEESQEGTLLVFNNGQYAAQDGFDIIEYNDDYSQVGGSKMGDDDLNDDPDDLEEDDFDLKIDCSPEIGGKQFIDDAIALKVDEEVSQTLVRSFYLN